MGSVHCGLSTLKYYQKRLPPDTIFLFSCLTASGLFPFHSMRVLSYSTSLVLLFSLVFWFRVETAAAERDHRRCMCVSGWLQQNKARRLSAGTHRAPTHTPWALEISAWQDTTIHTDVKRLSFYLFAPNERDSDFARFLFRFTSILSFDFDGVWCAETVAAERYRVILCQVHARFLPGGATARRDVCCGLLPSGADPRWTPWAPEFFCLTRENRSHLLTTHPT